MERIMSLVRETTNHPGKGYTIVVVPTDSASDIVISGIRVLVTKPCRFLGKEFALGAIVEVDADERILEECMTDDHLYTRSDDRFDLGLLLSKSGVTSARWWWDKPSGVGVL
jgi:hypothetical protein